MSGVPIQRVENASATGTAAMREAYLAIAGGHYDTALVVGFDKMTLVMGSAPNPQDMDEAILPAAFFAMWATRRMHERGTKSEHLAAIAAKNWNYGAACPYAHRRPDHQVTAEEVLASRMVAQPLTTVMCCPADDGAACVIVARDDIVRARQTDRALVRPLASALQSETYARGHTFVGPVVGPSTMTRDTARECYEAAGVGPEDVSLAFCHDAFVNEELEYYELLGFCGEGEAEKLVEAGETGPGGRIPFNTDGGLIARGHPAGPTGLAQIHELVTQLRGEAGRRQVENARVALAHLVGGGSVCTVSLLARDS
jgi:acetyl-CoA acetyltransferase